MVSLKSDKTREKEQSFNECLRIAHAEFLREQSGQKPRET